MATAAAGLLLSAPLARAGQVGLELVKDIDTAVVSRSSEPQRFRSIDGKVYFAAKTPETGEELFVSDGSATPPRLVADIARGAGSSMPTALGMAGGRLILAGNDGYRGEQFWAVDATGAATRLSSAAMPSYGEPPRALGNAGGRLVFRERGSSVWSSDGSAAGTQRLNLYLGDAAPLACSVGGRVVMLDRYSFKAGLVATDGTPANTVKVAELDGAENAYAASGGGYCYFGIHGHAHWKIWRSDGTAAGTSLWRESTTDSRLCGMAMLGSRVYVLEQRNGVRLVDAEEQAVRLSLVQDQCRTPLGMWVAAGRLVFFAPQDDINNSGSRALYVSDGTSAGTRPLALPANVYDWQTLKMAGIGEHVVFSTGYTATYSIDPVAGSITALPTYLQGLEQSDLAVLDGAMLLSANDGIHGYEPWRSDGTVAGTGLLHDVWRANADGLIGYDTAQPAAAVGDTLFFLRHPASDEGGARQLWRSDGSEAGTRALPRDTYDGAAVAGMVALGDGVLFVTERHGNPAGHGVYRADAGLSAAGLVWADSFYPSLLQAIPGGGALFACGGTGNGNVCALAPGVAQPAIVAPALQSDGNAQPLGQLGNLAFFMGMAGSADRGGLWRSDGTAPGTYRIAPDLYLPSLGWYHRPAAVAHNGRLWFPACRTGDDNCTLYVSDGSSNGTLRLADLPTNVMDIEPLGSRVAILVQSSSTQLWISDGTAAGTFAVASFTGAGAPALASTGDYVHFIAGDTSSPMYYVSDGTAAGTRAVALPPQTRPGGAAPVALDADTLVFRCTSPTTGEEFCVTDARGSQVRLLRDVFPGPSSSSPQFVGRAGAAAYFAIDDGRHGRELWRVQVLGDAIFANRFE
ncbi:ELWxxDGT repeat protein [Tahibacter aquaticus]|uniref:ELWxxDGT repeat protein n=1 Tax=Tahibacter aquaticus TaxID=520092 RepID=A0A4R6YV14_9GAMM|nr:ELWxxDGT repeat protein [Tahibacter aquaticus]